ncbi:hypothetical protein LX32DRAFT_708389 [Colletotrichum zoysiae]|uniref:Uncharacterized protein n=1 Tax=Colletotrichum zoysiae TaxID=1216348 RepID=A0AAD9M9M0_9PEZI|nr:hypothetical protein LX32DRAFT_708389 [Colletotrichum zoysiae]
MSHGLHDSGSRWRWHYSLEIGCAIISTCLYFRCYYPPSWKQLNVGGGTRLQLAKDLDIFGIFLFVSGCVQTILGLSTPALVPPRMFKDRRYFTLAVNALSASMIYLILYVSWPTITSQVFSRSSYVIAWSTSMLGISFFSGMALAGAFVAYIPKVRIQCHAVATVALLSLGYPWVHRDCHLDWRNIYLATTGHWPGFRFSGVLVWPELCFCTSRFRLNLGLAAKGEAAQVRRSSGPTGRPPSSIRGLALRCDQDGK